MQELLIIGALIVFSILEAAARAKKRDRPSIPPPEEWEEWEEDDGGVATAARAGDDDGIPGEPLPEYTRPYGGEAPQTRRTPAALRSKGMAPKEVWQEILDLAEGRRPGTGVPRQVPQTERPAPSPTPVRRTPAAPAATAAVQAVHRSHIEYGTDPSSRSGAGQVATVTHKAVSKEIHEVRRLLHGGRASLREAIVLQDVLGPPVGLRDPDA